jgi:hypothetical protein
MLLSPAKSRMCDGVAFSLFRYSDNPLRPHRFCRLTLDRAVGGHLEPGMPVCTITIPYHNVLMFVPGVLPDDSTASPGLQDPSCHGKPLAAPLAGVSLGYRLRVGGWRWRSYLRR